MGHATKKAAQPTNTYSVAKDTAAAPVANVTDSVICRIAVTTRRWNWTSVTRRPVSRTAIPIAMAAVALAYCRTA